MAERQAKRMRGRPRTETAAVNVRMPADMIAALDAATQDMIDGGEAITSRQDAVRHVLHDWLVGHGYLRHREDPEGAN